MALLLLISVYLLLIVDYAYRVCILFSCCGGEGYSALLNVHMHYHVPA